LYPSGDDFTGRIQQSRDPLRAKKYPRHFLRPQ
jgi:hypothetical protein